MVGPIRRVLFSETSLLDLAEVSNTTLTFVVILHSFHTACMANRTCLCGASVDYQEVLARRDLI